MHVNRCMWQKERLRQTDRKDEADKPKDWGKQKFSSPWSRPFDASPLRSRIEWFKILFWARNSPSSSLCLVVLRWPEDPPTVRLLLPTHAPRRRTRWTPAPLRIETGRRKIRRFGRDATSPPIVDLGGGRGCSQPPSIGRRWGANGASEKGAFGVAVWGVTADDDKRHTVADIGGTGASTAPSVCPHAFGGARLTTGWGQLHKHNAFQRNSMCCARYAIALTRFHP